MMPGDSGKGIALILVILGCSMNAENMDFEICGRLDHKDMVEISGVVASSRNPDILWVANDGGKERIWAVLSTGDLVMEVDYDSKVRDVEDLALGHAPDGTPALFIADVGDNNADRKSIRIIAIEEPVVNSSSSRKMRIGVKAEKKITYDSGAYDCETLIVDPISGNLLLITKELNGATVFRIEKEDFWDGSSKSVTAVHAGRIPTAHAISAGDISTDGQNIILRNEYLGWLWHNSSQTPELTLTRINPNPIMVRGDKQNKNGEAIAFHPNRTHYYSVSEGKNQPVYLFRLPQ